MQVYCSTQGYQRPRKQSKIASQRQYRVKEEGGFQELRDMICLVTGEVPQTRRETLKKAAELLRQMSTEGVISGHERLPASESPLASSHEFNQSVQAPYEPLMLPDETWIDASAPWASNSNSPIPDTSATSSMLEYHGYPQEDVYHAMGGDWNLVQPTPLQCQQTSFSAQWDDLTFIHSNIDHVPFYVEGLDFS
ncbi:hypothetical protein AZE42_04295 [Rhizopogon vesiculosus]|uniref:BHLH domain-containing protein n=1 Tax=Rhizopogon vesiculosus TaxID=180088 RepID=A0A1J8QRE6_9AGAM|nr:hypothetical protein AZE42_04295 [Rhizopogon vesiculosus]